MNKISELNKKHLFVPKILFFFMTLHNYTLHSFRGVFATDKFKIDKKDLGVGMGILQSITFFTGIWFGSLNDKWGASKWFLILFLTLSTVAFQLFYFDEYMNLLPGMFWYNLLLYLAFNLSIPPLLDKTIIDYLNRIPNIGAKTYGTQRLWGTLGYAVSNYIVEWAISDKNGKYTQYDNLRIYNIIVAITAIGLCLSLINWGTRRREVARSDILSSFKELVKNFDYMFFLLIILLNGMTRAAMTTYLTVYWKTVLDIQPAKIPKFIPGFLHGPINIFNKRTASTANSFGIAFEVLIFFVSQSIIGRIGYFWPLFLAQIAQLLRFACYWALPAGNPNAFFWVCCFELLKGVNFGLTHCSAVHLATKLCPPHLKATSQMLYQGTFTALGGVLSSLIIPRVFDDSKLKGKDVSIEDQSKSFGNFFLVNIAFNAITLVLFFYMYGIIENVLFNKENAQKKLDMYLEREKEERENEKVLNEKTITNK